MQTLTFKATIKDGIIRIPQKYRNQLPERVTIVVYPAEQHHGEDAIERLLRKPLRVSNFKPFSREEIYDRTL